MYDQLSNSSLESASQLSCEVMPSDPPSAEFEREMDDAVTDAWLCAMEAKYEAEASTKQRIAALTGKELFDWGIRNNGLCLTHQPHAHRCRSCAEVVLHGSGECAEPSHHTCPACQQAIQATLAEVYERAAAQQWQRRCQQDALSRASSVTRDGWEI